jgi:hypothetical protein
MPDIWDGSGPPVWDRSGPPPTGDDLRAVVAASGLADDLPITAALMEEIAQVSDQKTGDPARDDARTLTAIVNAIVSLERSIVDLKSDGDVDGGST